MKSVAMTLFQRAKQISSDVELILLNVNRRTVTFVFEQPISSLRCKNRECVK